MENEKLETLSIAAVAWKEERGWLPVPARTHPSESALNLLPGRMLLCCCRNLLMHHQTALHYPELYNCTRMREILTQKDCTFPKLHGSLCWIPNFIFAKLKGRGENCDRTFIEILLPFSLLLSLMHEEIIHVQEKLFWISNTGWSLCRSCNKFWIRKCNIVFGP